MSDCPGPTEHTRFYRQEMSATEVRAFEDHLRECALCQARHRELADELSRLEDEVRDLGPTVGVAPPVARVPDHIGSYRVLQKLGEGGMGVVYLAEQHVPLRRRVAVKVVKAGLDTREVLARFEAEREALALMDHPNVARVLDAGTATDGQPYFVMEYVQGIRITEYCDNNRQDIAGRLQLFEQVCSAVQHAHQKGIIHRDIKPSNILVGMQDGQPVVKVIDFGVAKATRQRLTDLTLLTAHGQLIGTPGYMAPEQAGTDALDIDTRADVYALGALLYELLVGKPPFDHDELKRAGIEEILRIIREKDPPRPSTRWSTMGEMSTIAARNRRIEASSLLRQLRGDLDWIILKAMDKDRTRRYATVAELSMDVERFLKNEPISASPPTVLYRIRKFVRRNRGFVTAAAVVLVVLCGGIVSSSLFAIGQSRAKVAASNAAREAKHAADMLADMVRSAGPRIALGEDTTLLRGILDQTAQRLDDGEYDGGLLTEATLRQVVGLAYLDLSEFKVAQPHLMRCYAIRQQLLDDGPFSRLAVADAAYALGRVQNKLGHHRKAEELNRQALAIRLDLLGADSAEVAHSKNQVGVNVLRQGRVDEAEVLFRESLAIRQALPGDHDIEIAQSIDNIAYTLGYRRNQLAESEALYRDALRIKALATDDVGRERMAVGLDNLSQIILKQGRIDEAEQHGREALQRRLELFGEDHNAIGVSLINLGKIAQEDERFDDAADLYRRGLAVHRAHIGPTHSRIAHAAYLLGQVYYAQEKYAAAEPLYLEALAFFRGNMKKKLIARVTQDLVALYEVWGHPQEADRYRQLLNQDAMTDTP